MQQQKKKKILKKIQAVSVNGSNPVRARIISGFLLLHLYLQRSSLHLK